MIDRIINFGPKFLLIMIILVILTLVIRFSIFLVNSPTLEELGVIKIEKTQDEYHKKLLDRQSELLSIWNIVMRAKYDDYLTNPKCDNMNIDGFNEVLERDQIYNNLLHARRMEFININAEFEIDFSKYPMDIKTNLGLK